MGEKPAFMSGGGMYRTLGAMSEPRLLRVEDFGQNVVFFQTVRTTTLHRGQVDIHGIHAFSKV